MAANPAQGTPGEGTYDAAVLSEANLLQLVQEAAQFEGYAQAAVEQEVQVMTSQMSRVIRFAVSAFGYARTCIINLTSKVNAVEHRVADAEVKIEGKFGEMDNKCQAMEAQVNTRLNEINQLMSTADSTYKGLEVKVSAILSAASAAQDSYHTTQGMVQSEIDRINAADNQMTGRVQHLEQVVGNIQSNGVSSSSEGKGGGRWGTNKSAMEHKAVMNLKTQGNDRAGYRMWHEKLVNAFAQVNGQYRGILERVAKEIDKGTDMSIMQGNADWESWVSMVDIASDKVDMSKLNEDMYSVLMDKSEGDAWLRVKSVNSGHGMEAFVKVYKWFMSTSGQGLSERARAIMAPTPPKSEGDMAEAVDKWNEGLRLLENHPGYSMHVNLKVTALKQLMVGRAKDHFETWEEDMKNQGVEDNQWRWILGKVQEYATRRRLEANLAKGKNPMDVDGIDGASSWDSQGNWDWQQDEAGYMWGACWDNAGDIDALGKGKAMGKGGKSKGKGKGVFNGKCYNCLLYTSPSPRD